MIHLIATIATVLHIYKKCPKCGHPQSFHGKKKGEEVECKKCKHRFILK